MAWCCQATGHYQSQCWSRSRSTYGVAGSQWVNYLHCLVVEKWWQRKCKYMFPKVKSGVEMLTKPPKKVKFNEIQSSHIFMTNKSENSWPTSNLEGIKFQRYSSYSFCTVCFFLYQLTSHSGKCYCSFSKITNQNLHPGHVSISPEYFWLKKITNWDLITFTENLFKCIYWIKSLVFWYKFHWS